MHNALSINLHNYFNHLVGYPHPKSQRDSPLVSLKISLEIAMWIIFDVNVVHSLANRQTIRNMCIVAKKAIYSSFIVDHLNVIFVVILWYFSNE